MKQVFERSAQTIEFPHDHYVTRSELLNHLLKLRSVPAATAGFLLKNAFDTRFLQSALLKRGVLFICAGL